MAQSAHCHFLKPTADVPNNRLPVLHYRGVLPQPLTEESVTKFLTTHSWEKRGTWGHIAIRHFHPNSHECYGIFQGSSKVLLGSLDPGRDSGIVVNVEAGDVIVLPAGTGHSSLESSPDYKYIGVYPQGCPRWTNEMGDHPAESFVDTVRNTGMPENDPVYGLDGPLCRIWKSDIRARL